MITYVQRDWGITIHDKIEGMHKLLSDRTMQMNKILEEGMKEEYDNLTKELNLLVEKSKNMKNNKSTKEESNERENNNTKRSTELMNKKNHDEGMGINRQ